MIQLQSDHKITSQLETYDYLFIIDAVFEKHLAQVW